jgi:hypothetical protein
MKRHAGPQLPERPAPPGAEARWAGQLGWPGPANFREQTQKAPEQEAAGKTEGAHAPQPRSSRTEDPSPAAPSPAPSTRCGRSC